MKLPTEKRKPLSENPGVILIYSAPKVGKTTIVAQLQNSLLVECEPRGADFIEGMIVEINNPPELEALIKEIKDKGKPYKYLVIDTVTKLDEWSEIVGTYEYMNKSQGKSFNRYAGKKLTHFDKEFETVHEIGKGFGYKHSREVMARWYTEITELAEHVVLLAHIKDKYIESKTGEVVESTDISLTGKVKFMYTTRVDAVAYLFRKGNQGILSFAKEDNIMCGSRPQHLVGDIVISEKQEDGTIKTFWDKIFIKTNNKT